MAKGALMAREVLEAPITGKVLRVNVANGSAVKEGDIVCVLLSMKMEIPIRATASGKVAELHAAAEQVVKAGDSLAVIET